MLAALYSANQTSTKSCHLTSLLETYGLARLIPDYFGRDIEQLRSARATLRRTFHSLEKRELVECEIRLGSVNDNFAERLWLRITAAGIDYVESRELPLPFRRLSPTRRRDPLGADADEWARLDSARAGSGGSGRQSQLDADERRLIEAALKRGVSWQALARRRGFSGEEAMQRRYRLLSTAGRPR